MFKVEGGAIVFYAKNSIEKIHAHGVTEKKLDRWSKAIKEYDKVQVEMKEIFDIIKNNLT